MELVGLAPQKERAGQYPFQISGGMAQRCVIAIALAAEPSVLFADEATTSLVVTLQGSVFGAAGKNGHVYCPGHP